MANNPIALYIPLKLGAKNDKEKGIMNLQEFNSNVKQSVAYFMEINSRYINYVLFPGQLFRIPYDYVLLAQYNAGDLTSSDIVIIYNKILNGKLIPDPSNKDIQPLLVTFTNSAFPYWCSKPSTNPLYATDPLNGKILKESSYFRSSESLGLYCRLWEVNPAAIGVEEAKIGYCKANPNSFECACINSKDNTYYKAFNNPDNIPDACWFKPCMLKTSTEGFDDYIYLVPKTKQNPVCPPVLTITFNENQTLVTKQEADKYFLTPPSPTPPGPTPPGPTPPGPTPPGPTPPNFFETYKWWIIGFGALLFIIILILYNANKKKKI